jgi:hypothetical protein
VTRLRIPVVTGLGHDTGASTVAAALHGRDAGAWAAAADIVVCRGGGESMRAAEALRLAPFGLRPVLALTHPGAAPAAAHLRVRRLGCRFAAIVELPHVPRWQVLGDAPADVGELLGVPAAELEPAVAAYAEALRELVAAVLAGGQLTEPVPPVLIRSVAPSSPDPPARPRPAPTPEAGLDRRALLTALVAAGHPALRLDDRAG